MDIDYIVDLIAYIIIYSFLGWVLESVYKTYMQKKIVNSGFLIGPFCPIYGFGAAIMYVFLDGFKDNIILLFFIATIILSVWEYMAGFILEKLFKTKYWDYSYKKFHLHGRICLDNSIVWGILGVVFTTILHPFVMASVDKISIDTLMYIEAVLIIILVVDGIISTTKVTNINIRLDYLNEISEALKQRIEELKEISDKSNAKRIESIKRIIEDLKEKQVALQENIMRRTSRLRKAFPSMKLKNLNEVLNKKIDIVRKTKKR